MLTPPPLPPKKTTTRTVNKGYSKIGFAMEGPVEGGIQKVEAAQYED